MSYEGNEVVKTVVGVEVPDGRPLKGRFEHEDVCRVGRVYVGERVRRDRARWVPRSNCTSGTESHKNNNRIGSSLK